LNECVRFAHNFSKSVNAVNTTIHNSKLTPLPLLGRIAAGQPIEAIAGQERLDLSDLREPGHPPLHLCGEAGTDSGRTGVPVAALLRNNFEL
jgi:hypothetical protein